MIRGEIKIARILRKYAQALSNFEMSLHQYVLDLISEAILYLRQLHENTRSGGVKCPIKCMEIASISSSSEYCVLS